MDTNLKSKWIDALRSGEFKQAQGSLKHDDGYCCLGVLCVLKGMEFDAQDQIISSDWNGSYAAILPDLSKQEIEDLWPRNDGAMGQHQHSFAEMADYIEKTVTVTQDKHGND